jgi:multicomponent Na+:H+ antiporter subunit E
MTGGAHRRALAARALLYFGVWIIVDQSAEPANLAVGLLAAAAATWVSMRLLPPASGRVRLGVLLTLLPRFLWQSLVAGIDVARRAFSPRLPLRPGFVDYPVRLPRGSARNAFEAISSLLPGSVPSDESEESIEYHCLDTGQPVAEQLAAEERAYSKALVPGRRHG